MRIGEPVSERRNSELLGLLLLTPKRCGTTG
jgi:hypothetical protein